jgi:hypothetical protein
MGHPLVTCLNWEERSSSSRPSSRISHVSVHLWVISHHPINSAPHLLQRYSQEIAIFLGSRPCPFSIARTPQTWISSSRHYSPETTVVARDARGVFRIGEGHGLDPRKITISWGSRCRRWGAELIEYYRVTTASEERWKFDWKEKWQRSFISI